MKLLPISYLRVSAMLMVVYFHCLCHFATNWSAPEDLLVPSHDAFAYLLNAIDMPMFIYISGYLYAYLYFGKGKYHDNVAFLRGKARRLLLPYILWGVLLLFIFPQMHTVHQLFTGISHLWFLLTLMLLFVIVQFTRSRWENLTFRSAIRIFAFFLALRVLALNGVHGKVLLYMPFFVLGMISSRFCLTERVCRIRHKVPLLILSLLLVFPAWLLCWYWHHIHLARSIAWLFTGISAMILIPLVHSILERRTLPQSRLMESLDRNSMGIYILHHIFIVGAFCNPPLCVWLENHSLIAPTVLFLAVLPVSWILSEMIGRTRLSFVFG